MSLKKAIVIFSGYNPRAIVAFLRVAEKNGIPFHIIAASVNDTILQTDYARNVFQIRESSEFSFEAILPVLLKLRIEESIGELVVLPSTEYLNRVMLKFRSDFLAHKISIPLVEEGIYQQVSDKFKFRQICESKGLLVPKRYTNVAKVQPPFVIKPKKYFSPDGRVQFKPQLIYTEAQWKAFNRECQAEDYYIEEYVKGKSYYLLYYISNSGGSISYSQQNLVQQAEGGSMLLARSATIHETKISREYQQLLIQLGFHGLVMIELKETSEGMWMIEANPRLWGPSQLFVDAGVPIFERFLEDLGFTITSDVGADKTETSRYFWFGGLGSRGLNDPDLAYHDGMARDEFTDQLMKNLLNDIYMRPDTLAVFEQEIKSLQKR